MTTSPEPTDDFEAAKAVFEKLKDLSKERQERVLRWVAEGLGFSNTSPAPPRDRPAEIPSASSGGVTLSAGTLQPASMDIKSFIAAKNPRSDQQFATAVAYYYKFEAPLTQRREWIDTKIVQEATRLAGRRRLTKPKNTLNNARNQGYLDRVNLGEYAINTVGENMVAMTLPGGGAANPSRTASKPRSKKSQKKRR